MNDHNSVILVGHVVNVPEVNKSKKIEFATFALAVNRTGLNFETGEAQKVVDFHRCTMDLHRCTIIGALADEFQTLKKGQGVLVHGYLANRAYTGANSLVHYITEIQLQSVTILS